MSADRRATMGVQHLTVVPENFDPAVDGADVDGDEVDDADGDDEA